MFGLLSQPHFHSMELLLNLLWLLLAMPAFWLWRYSRTAPERRKASPFHCLLALVCMLVVLFPVISATDDLRAMRAESEESPVSKRSVSHPNGGKLSPSNSHSQPPVPVTMTLSFALDSARYRTPSTRTSNLHALVIVRSSRAPPYSPLG